jgi:hypothetical protein
MAYVDTTVNILEYTFLCVMKWRQQDYKIEADSEKARQDFQPIIK